MCCIRPREKYDAYLRVYSVDTNQKATAEYKHRSLYGWGCKVSDFSTTPLAVFRFLEMHHSNGGFKVGFEEQQ